MLFRLCVVRCAQLGEGILFYSVVLNRIESKQFPSSQDGVRCDAMQLGGYKEASSRERNTPSHSLVSSRPRHFLEYFWSRELPAFLFLSLVLALPLLHIAHDQDEQGPSTECKIANILRHSAHCSYLCGQSLGSLGRDWHWLGWAGLASNAENPARILGVKGGGEIKNLINVSYSCSPQAPTYRHPGAVLFISCLSSIPV